MCSSLQVFLCTSISSPGSHSCPFNKTASSVSDLLHGLVFEGLLWQDILDFLVIYFPGLYLLYTYTDVYTSVFVVIIGPDTGLWVYHIWVVILFLSLLCVYIQTMLAEEEYMILAICQET